MVVITAKLYLLQASATSNSAVAMVCKMRRYLSYSLPKQTHVLNVSFLSIFKIILELVQHAIHLHLPIRKINMRIYDESNSNEHNAIKQSPSL